MLAIFLKNDRTDYTTAIVFGGWFGFCYQA
jgi:hypothetical protein